MNPKTITRVLVTDCGSTTTKALLFEKTSKGWRQTFRGEAPTTVEAPVADVTVGALNAFLEIEELSGFKILQFDNPKIPFKFKSENESTTDGIDIYLSTSSAGGGLQMIVAGIVRDMTAESAQRAALGAGAIVLDVLSADDGREEHQRIEQVRALKPDIVLLTGGVDGGAKAHVLEVAEMLLAASPRPRFGNTLKLPVIYAGNKEAANEVRELLDKNCQITVVSNVRPSLESENLHPAREAIHDFFLSHVMSHSPGYDKLLTWTEIPIVPTPSAVGDVVQDYAKNSNKQVLCVDIGGATTDVFSVFKDQQEEFVFNRTVSANLGMSYSVANVLIESGPDLIARWLPYEITDTELRDRLRNKMIRPTSIPQTLEDLWLEQAVCREALRLSLQHHKSLAMGLGGSTKARGIADIFKQSSNRYELVNLMNLDVVIGSGGVLSHAPHRNSTALMMIDGFGLQGVTQLAVDSIFMMPHLGVFSKVNLEAAREVFEADCLVNIGYVIAPLYDKERQADKVIARVYIDGVETSSIISGKLLRVDVPLSQEVTIKIVPVDNKVDVGAGRGQQLEKRILPGLSGIFLDGRNRPLEFISDKKLRIQKQVEVYKTLGLINQ
jgi:uncharacterized protein (TIGR01319 family)